MESQINEIEKEIENLVWKIELDNLGEELSIEKLPEKLNKFNRKPGVYVFLKDNEVVYIGKTGKSQGLAERISKHLRGNPEDSNLGKNIDEIENNSMCKNQYTENCCKNEEDLEKRAECCKKYKDRENKEIYKNCLNKLINKYINGIRIIPTSTSLMASILEALLIYKYKSLGQAKYNKDET